MGPPPYEDEVALAARADEALAAGDTIGEFYLLQLKELREGTLDPYSAQRMLRLQREHHRALLGPLHGALTHVRYRGGLPWHARLSKNRPQVLGSLGDVRWSRLEALEVGTRQRPWVPGRLHELCAQATRLVTLTELAVLPKQPCPRIARVALYDAQLVHGVFEVFPHVKHLELLDPALGPEQLTDDVLARLDGLVVTLRDQVRLRLEGGRWRLGLGTSHTHSCFVPWVEFAAERGATINSSVEDLPPPYDWLEPWRRREDWLPVDDDAPF